MPLFQREHVQFAILFLCVPIQYFIVQNSGSSESSCTHLIVKQIQDFQRYWLSPVSWTKWCKKLLLDRADPGTGTVDNFALFLVSYLDTRKISVCTKFPVKHSFYNICHLQVHFFFGGLSTCKTVISNGFSHDALKS